MLSIEQVPKSLEVSQTILLSKLLVYLIEKKQYIIWQHLPSSTGINSSSAEVDGPSVGLPADKEKAQTEIKKQGLFGRL